MKFCSKIYEINISLQIDNFIVWLMISASEIWDLRMNTMNNN